MLPPSDAANDEADGSPALITAAELIEGGADPAAVAKLPVRHVGPDGVPFWPLDEALHLLTMALIEEANP